MKIASLRIKNLRSFSDVTISFNDYTCLVGPNGAGKSTVLCALNVLFRETENVSTDLSQLTAEDFHQKKTAEPIEITVTFTDLNEEAQQDFADYFRQGQLVLSAVATFNEVTARAEVKQMGQRLVIPDFKDFFRAVGDKKPVAELKQLYSAIRSNYVDLPAPGTKDAMITALHEYEDGHQDQCELIASEDQFYGISKGANRLAKYVQWVFVPAVKDAATEQIEARNTALGKLLARTVRSKINFEENIRELRKNAQNQYQELLDQSQGVLDDISSSLRTRLAEWAHPDATLKLQWSQDPEKSIRVEDPFARIIAGEGDFEGELARFGHGLQRSYLLALLQELASYDGSGGPRLILGCEEPELYQHPPQARHLAAVLQKLSRGNSQVIVSSHHPTFVSGEGFEDVRLVRRDPVYKRSNVAHMSYADIANAVAAATGEQPKRPEGVLAKIHQALQPSLNEMFFTPRLVLVEGLEDVAYIAAYLNLIGRWEDYRRAGCHVVPANGKSEMLRPLVIAKHMCIPTFVVFDADAEKPDRNGSRAKHEKDNKALLTLLGRSAENPMPMATLWGAGFVMWHSDIGAIVRDDVGVAAWDEAQTEADKHYGHVGDLRKNALHIGMVLAYAWNAGKRSPHLERLCCAILDPVSSV